MDQLLIDVFSQKLFHLKKGLCHCVYPISTAAKGVGELADSFQTPRGWHIIRAKIGDGLPLNSVLISRRPTGEVYSFKEGQAESDRDWILTRIMWLSGLEKGKNRLGSCDTMQRYIYIHGSPNHRVTAVPGSKGCIRMRNEDILKLFSEVSVGTKVFIRG